MLQFLCDGLEEDFVFRQGGEQRLRDAGAEEMVRACGKMVLLDKLLPKLRAEGRQVGGVGSWLGGGWRAGQGRGHGVEGGE